MSIKESFKSGMFFGLTSGVLTTIGLMVGLAASTSSKFIVIGAVVTIAISDALSDALGMHISKESEEINSRSDAWSAFLGTFSTKFVLALSFIFPVLYLDLYLSVIVNIIWGSLILFFSSYYIASTKKEKILSVLLEHFSLAFLIIAISYFVGAFVSTNF